MKSVRIRLTPEQEAELAPLPETGEADPGTVEARKTFGDLLAECMDQEFWNFRAPDLLKDI